MITLFHRKNGYYYIIYRQDGIRRQKSTGKKIKSEALAWLTHWPQSTKAVESQSLSNFIIRFLEYACINKSPKSVENDSRALHWLLKIIGDKKLITISISDVEKFKSVRSTEVSKTTVNIDLRTCKAAFNIALKWGYISKNPFKESPQLKVPMNNRVHLTFKDLCYILGLVKETWLKNVIIFAMNTGCRRGEIVNLRWNHIDLDKQLIWIEHSADFVVKGGKSRVIPMNRVIYELLQTLDQSSEFVLGNANGKKLYPNYIRERFKDYIRKAELDESLHFHHIRHAFTTQLLELGISIYEVQQILGHSSVTTTQIYSHMGVERLRSAMAILESK